jgi:polyhydroxybutyrate depolymerase
MKTKTLLSILVLTNIFTTSFSQSFVNETMQFDGNAREYDVYVPAMYDGTSAVPLIFSFHGGGGDIAGNIATNDLTPIADTANFIVVYPQAIPDPGNGGSTSWMHKQPTTHDDVPFVAAMIDSISANYNINLDRIYACGYSLGGEFCYELACQLNDEIAAIGAVARTMGTETFNNCAPVHPTGVMTILGTSDPISDYNGVWYLGVQYYMSAEEQHDYWVDFNNCDTVPMVTAIPDTAPTDGSTVERFSWSTADGCVYVEELKVTNGDHDWPGTFGNMDINATNEIWQFVSRYDLNGIINCATSSIDEIGTTNLNFSVYPNPSNGEVTIENNFSENKAFRIYSTLSEVVLSGQVNPGIHTVDLSNLPANIYILEIENQVIKLIKTE